MAGFGHPYVLQQFEVFQVVLYFHRLLRVCWHGHSLRCYYLKETYLQKEAVEFDVRVGVEEEEIDIQRKAEST